MTEDGMSDQIEKFRVWVGARMAWAAFEALGDDERQKLRNQFEQDAKHETTTALPQHQRFRAWVEQRMQWSDFEAFRLEAQNTLRMEFDRTVLAPERAAKAPQGYVAPKPNPAVWEKLSSKDQLRYLNSHRAAYDGYVDKSHVEALARELGL